MKLILTNSYPAINENDISQLEHSISCALPQEYKNLLLGTNGGFTKYEDCYFEADVPFSTLEGAENKVKDSLDEIFGIAISAKSKNHPNSILELYERYKEEDFLPEGVIAIGRCGTDSLLCISANQADYGHLYYWYYYWQYPWAKSFFEQKIDAVVQQYPNITEIAEKPPDSPEYRELASKMNYATLTHLANSIGDFENILFSEDTNESN